MFGNKKNNCENSLKAMIIIIVCAVIVIVLAAGVSAVKIKRQMEKEVASPYYQAVFLTNGQVYFGKLSGVNDKFPVLTDVYYLQANRNLQAPKEDGEVENKVAQPDLSLIKLGNELHAPQDKIFLNRDHILFVVDLKDEGQVAQTIKNYYKR